MSNLFLSVVLGVSLALSLPLWTSSRRLLQIGLFNTGLIPPILSEQSLETVIDYLPCDLDVLVLQEVWDVNQQVKIAERLNKEYPYFWSTGTMTGPDVRCRNGAQAKKYLKRFGNCLAWNQVTYIGWHTIGPCLSILEEWLKVDEDCALCSLSQSINGTVAEVISCVTGPGESRHPYGGSYGIMVLSKKPIENAGVVQTLQSFILRRGVATFSVDGVSYGTSHFDFSYVIDLPQARQKAFADVLLRERPDVILGDLNSGYNFQPEAYDKLIEAGYYDPSPNLLTFCPEPKMFTSGCTVNGSPGNPPITIRTTRDHILLNEDFPWEAKELYSAVPFAPLPVSDHIGIRLKTII